MILCGTDFSGHAAQAADVAAALALGLGEPLELTHVLTEEEERRATDARARLEAEAARLARAGLEISVDIAHGEPDEAIVEHARKASARMLVIAGLGYRQATRWLLGSVAQRIVNSAVTPVLVVRESAPLLAWMKGERRLKVFIAADLSPSTDVCIRWAGDLRRVAPCDLTVANVYFPPDEYRRLGLKSPAGLLQSHPEIEKHLLRDLNARIRALPGEGEAKVIVRPSLGRPADDLVLLAEHFQADLMVVASNQRKGLSRLWHGSVAQGIVQQARVAVANLPAAIMAERERGAIPDVRIVLASTDLSPLGNRAVPHAYSLLPRGGTVHLVHVVSPEGARPSDKELTEALSRLVPTEAANRQITTHVEIVISRAVAAAICQAAERHGVDVVCLASHGASGITQALTGSVARDVFGGTHRPVLLVRPPA